MGTKLGPVIAIDGPAGTGKSSVTKQLAEKLKFTHVDTGSLYRAIAYLATQSIENSESTNQMETLAQAANRHARTAKLEFKRIMKLNPKNRVFANDTDVTNFIRTPEISMMASQVSSVPEVRAALLGLQRKLGALGRTILEGRDIGTVIFPDADVKFFMTASVEERAKRRLAELEVSGSDVPTFQDVKNQISDRVNKNFKVGYFLLTLAQRDLDLWPLGDIRR